MYDERYHSTDIYVYHYLDRRMRKDQYLIDEVISNITNEFIPKNRKIISVTLPRLMIMIHPFIHPFNKMILSQIYYLVTNFVKVIISLILQNLNISSLVSTEIVRLESFQFFFFFKITMINQEISLVTIG